ncbi:hypothetical protein [Streptomyces chilikensis]|uniref:hypothetical protein n=1 Tax=Streptomyces chilikensis TaxID=1194079 RepID=UPI000A4A9C22|nr:hypothetical protein [Streptomyces chilikensis]
MAEKVLFRAAVTAVVTLAAIATAPVAMAAGTGDTGEVSVQAISCDSSGWLPGGDPRERCTSLGNGVLAHSKRRNSDLNTTVLRTSYYKREGTAISAQLGRNYNGSTVYAAATTISSGATVSKSWSVSGDKTCLNSVGLLKYSGGSYQTPVAHC